SNQILQVAFLENMDAGLSVIRSNPHTRDVQIEDHTATVEFSGNDEEVATLLEQLMAQNVRLRSFAQKEPTLEDVFMMVTKGLVS
ncbi:MAG: DUF4162 domain-containing protein, partial [Planctomycetes bacterium]|nr:DUF4162 domain-containing protein [Planctomycetota bacterium]